MSFLVYATCNPEATKDMSVCELGCEGEYDLAIDAYFDKLEQCNEEYAAYFQVQGRFAVVVGVLMGSSFTNRVRALKEDHPEVDTLILLQVPGSIGDDANIVGYKLVHDYGYKTCIPDVGYGGVASGGTDLLLAGVERYVAEPVVGSFSASGTSIGIHAWSGSGVPDANTLSRTDSRHNLFLDYFDYVCMPEEFYWETLSHGVPMYYIPENEMDTKFPYMRSCNDTCSKNNAGAGGDDDDDDDGNGTSGGSLPGGSGDDDDDDDSSSPSHRASSWTTASFAALVALFLHSQCY